MKALTVIKKQATTATIKASEIFEDVRNEIMNGNADPIKVFTFFHQLSEVFTQLKADEAIRTATEKEILKHGKTVDLHGFSLKVTDRKSYDFSACNDPYLNELKTKLIGVKTEIEQREQFLKVIDCQTTDEKAQGVMIQPATAYFTRIITVSPLKKAA